jgi:hypothetical protein
MLKRFLLIGAAASFCVSACGESQTAARPTGAVGEFRLERFCDVPELRKSLRHTFILIDQRALAKASSAAEFAKSNGAVRDAVLAFGDPVGAIQSGALDYRERVSILLLPIDGSAAKLLFEGCVPALSPEEMAASRKGSALADFFTGGTQQSLRNEAEAFRTRIVSGIVLAAREAPGEPRPKTEGLANSSLIESMRTSGRLINAEKGLPRVVLLSNLGTIDLVGADTRAKARELGFQQGSEVGLDLGRAGLHIMLMGEGSSPLARDYAESFFLAQHARLLSWGRDMPAKLPSAPVAVSRFTGEAQYPSGPESIQVRLATDRNGALVDSWLILRGAPDRATPLTGQETCEGLKCTLRSDDGGFAQAWSLSPGADPEFNNDFPFGGVRDWEIVISGSRLIGRAFDPAVQMGTSNSISIEAHSAENANF